ncbi:MAG TPA: DUF3558 domain-containing protein [Pseudonocardia sp.]
MLLVLSLGGCGSRSAPPRPEGPIEPARPTASPLPPRPATLRLDSVDPCALLTPAQVARLSLLDGIPSARPDGRDCVWGRNPPHPDNAWRAQVILTHGADYYRGSVTGAQLREISGYTAVATNSTLALNRDHQCLLYVDVAPGQSLEVSYHNLDGDYPGINHEVACQLAGQVAGLMLANLKARAAKGAR